MGASGAGPLAHSRLLAFDHPDPYIRNMAKKSRPLSCHIDLSSPEFLNSFRETAAAFDKKHTASPEAALKQLMKERVLTRSGKLTRHYSGK